MLEAQRATPLPPTAPHYNEVVVDGRLWEMGLPSSIEAVFYVRDDLLPRRLLRRSMPAHAGRRLEATPVFAGRLMLRNRLTPRACAGPVRAHSRRCALARAEARARAVHASLLRLFGLDARALPLLELNASDWHAPFSDQ